MQLPTLHFSFFLLPSLSFVAVVVMLGVRLTDAMDGDTATITGLLVEVLLGVSPRLLAVCCVASDRALSMRSLDFVCGLGGGGNGSAGNELGVPTAGVLDDGAGVCRDIRV